jgi:hypothetical protein
MTITDAATTDFWSSEMRPRTRTRSPKLISLKLIFVAEFKFVDPGGTRRNDTLSESVISKSGPASVCNVKLPA